MKLLFSLCVFTVLMQPLFAQNKKDKLEIYLLLGQSNMAGRGEITPEFIDEGHPNLLMFNKEKEWVAAKHPLHFDKPKVAGVGPGIAFGIKMASASPNVQIGLVPCAVGGTSISKWEPDKYDKETDTYPYNDAVIRIREAMKTGVVKGMIWHQGESDTKPETAAKYLANLDMLIDRIRKLCKNPNLPVVVGELGVFKDNRKIINEVLAEVPAKIKFTAVAKSNGLKHKGDEAHFDGASAQIIGYRFAEQMLILQKK